MEKVQASSSSLVRSQKIVAKAVGVFSQAVAEVEKANDILTKGIESDSMQIMGIENKIAELEYDIMKLKEAKLLKGNEFTNNENLLATLRQFTKEG